MLRKSRPAVHGFTPKFVSTNAYKYVDICLIRIISLPITNLQWEKEINVLSNQILGQLFLVAIFILVVKVAKSEENFQEWYVSIDTTINIQQPQNNNWNLSFF